MLAWRMAASLLIAAWPSNAQPQAAQPCDRACLSGLLEKYLDALVARNPSRLPLARAVKFTENGQRLEPHALVTFLA